MLKNKYEALRAYSLNNMYLSGIHGGIQTTHSHDECSIKYLINGSEQKEISVKLYKDWIINHKVVAVLNGGFQQQLQDFYDFLMHNDHPYPFEKFHESKEALNGALTNITVVLPDYVFMNSRTISGFLRKLNINNEQIEGEYGLPDVTETTFMSINRVYGLYKYEFKSNSEDFLTFTNMNTKEKIVLTIFDVRLMLRIAPLDLAK